MKARCSHLPLALYVHFPWCVSKCFYCDFNSFRLPSAESIAIYLERLLLDLKTEAQDYPGESLRSIYFGGGTPSLIPPDGIEKILQEIAKYFHFTQETEITLEANPGTIDTASCSQLRRAGINRISLGVQSLDDSTLRELGRSHQVVDILQAVQALRESGFKNFNLDLMFALPGQSVASALVELENLLALHPPHLSWYQLSLDFRQDGRIAQDRLPDSEVVWEIQTAGQRLLASAGLRQYEVSAYARSADYFCQHNLNYWYFGDYLGVGCGAHGKVTLPNYSIKRYNKIAHPSRYLNAAQFVERETVINDEQQRAFEFMLNALRLFRPISYRHFSERTGLDIEILGPQLREAVELGLLIMHPQYLMVTEQGKNFLNELLELFL